MYNLWPESVPFRDCADLNFPQYLEKIKDPIALDVIKERLDEENPDQVNKCLNYLGHGTLYDQNDKHFVVVLKCERVPGRSQENVQKLLPFQF